ncbi:tetratricopeptide repeat protein [Patescibacteria group bacterium]|nr:tetratricopeptide repeat protein [Patescibacteria group bacterium]MBU1844696.1 tetratricopeptide repeat protein [Patescibacteria group bacterium]
MKQQQAKVYYQAGNDFLKKREYPKAIASYKQAIKIMPDYFKAYCNLGVAYKCAGLFKEAENIYVKALKIKPNSGVVYNNLGNVYMSTDRLKEAEFFYKRAIKIYPKYREAYYNLGQVYYFTGETKKALETRIILEKLRSPSKSN